MKRQKGGKKADELGTLEPERQHGGEFAELSVCLIYSRFGAEEASNPGCQWAQTKKPQQKPTLSNQKRVSP